MNDAPVVTKLRAPRARPNLVARPRPPEGLGREPRRRLTLPSAPAGFGKTTLLVEWLWGRAGGGPSVAWLSLDGGDNDPARFLFYLVAALKTIEEGVGDGGSGLVAFAGATADRGSGGRLDKRARGHPARGRRGLR